MEKAYDAVKDVTKKKELWRLGVVVDDLWITYKGGSEEHIELLLRDVKGDTIQATILRDDIAKWKDKLNEGKTYSMRNFRVTKNEGGFKMTPHNFMLTFVGTTTKVEEIVMPEIPATLFKFKDFAEILAGNYRPDLCIDVIGVVHTVGKCVTPTNTRKGSAAFILSDLSHQQIDCTLWDAMSVKFLDHINSRPDFGPVVIIMKHVRVKEPQGIYNIQLSNVWDGTKLLFDESIPEIKTFKDSLAKNVDYNTQQSAISTSTQMYTQGSVGTQYNSDEYFMKDAQVVRLADMKKLNEDTLCVCIVTTSHVIISTQGWYFMSCTECQTKAEGNEPPFVCRKGHKTTDPVIKYKLDVEVEDVDDEEETAKFVFWDSTLNDLLGISTKDLIAKMKKAGITDLQDYPDELNEMMHRTFAMRVKWQHSWNQASVSKCKDSKDLIAKIQDQLPVAESLHKETLTIEDTPCDEQPQHVAQIGPVQTFSQEDFNKFSGLDDAILSTPNFSASADNEVTGSIQKTPAKRGGSKKQSYDDEAQTQASSTRSGKHIKKEK
ncbi:hypothetical protein P8452_58633 [Trifolium repens]|nr:hypothetical protein P8452_58633 [Trifolium repens]